MTHHRPTKRPPLVGYADEHPRPPFFFLNRRSPASRRPRPSALRCALGEGGWAWPRKGSTDVRRRIDRVVGGA